MQSENPVVFSWCTSPQLAADITSLFVANMHTDYISHTELQGGRALSRRVWRPDLADIMQQEIHHTLSAGLAHERVAIGQSNGNIVCAALLSIDTQHIAHSPYATMEDVVLSPQVRGQGLGQHFITWMETELTLLGIKRLFLESGINNHHAHHFFEHQGFSPLSVVMMKELG
jgi:N-acetylglutamate synthase-like GNAT family acetyltransferase